MDFQPTNPDDRVGMDLGPALLLDTKTIESLEAAGTQGVRDGNQGNAVRPPKGTNPDPMEPETTSQSLHWGPCKCL